MKLKDVIVEAVQQPQIDAVVGWGRGMGHSGHMLLARAVIVQAQQMNATPFFFVSQTMGKDDPLTPEEKLSIYKKVFPKFKNIFRSGKTLAEVLTSVGKQYKNVVLVLGEDQVQPFQWLLKPDKSGNLVYKTYGLDSLQIISRQQVDDPAQSEEGPRATPMRQVLLDPNATDEQKYSVWRRDMPKELSDNEVMHFMQLAQQRLTGITKEGILGFMIGSPEKKPVKKPQPADDFTAKLIANRQKNQSAPRKEKVYQGPEDYRKATGKEVKENTMNENSDWGRELAQMAMKKYPHALVRHNDTVLQEPPKREMPKQEPEQIDIDKLRELHDLLQHKYKQLGGDSWQYADRMTDRDREAQEIGRKLNVVKSKIAQYEKTMTENVDSNEYDDEAGMIKTNLRTSMRAVKGLYKEIGDGENCPEWVQEKIAIANDYLVTCWDYMISQHEEGNVEVNEEKPGLWANIHAKRNRIKHGSGEHMRKPGSKGAPTSQAFKDSQKTSKTDEAANAAQQAAIAINMKKHGDKPKSVEEQLAEDWQKVNKSDKTDGMSKKAVNAYRRENPGSKLKTAVTTKPSKLKKGSKAANRRKSFCARMSGMKKAHASAKTKRDPDSPINKALRRWNCESVEEMEQLMLIAEQKISELRQLDETKRMSAQVKLQRAFQREQEKSKASRERAEKLLNPKGTGNNEPKQDAGERSKRDDVAEDNDPCWDGYKQIGMKKKAGKKVPNCVPVNEDYLEE